VALRAVVLGTEQLFQGREQLLQRKSRTDCSGPMPMRNGLYET
jgi:hypothetical protein